MRRIHVFSAIAVLVIGACFLFSACDRHPTHIWGMWSEDRIQRLVCDGQVFLVLAINDSLESDVSGGNVSSSSWAARGKWRAPDGKRMIEWSCHAKDGATGIVKVNGQAFDLGKGGLLLISANDNKTKVEQLTVDMSKLQDAVAIDGLQALAKAEPRIAEFLKAPKAEK